MAASARDPMTEYPGSLLFRWYSDVAVIIIAKWVKKELVDKNIGLSRT
jgi:hypothetical protein